MVFTGTGVAIVTPFSADGTIDFDALRDIINHCIAGGVDYIVAMGTTAETVTLKADEKKDILRCVVETVAGRVQTVVGIGGYDTADLLETIKHTDFTGVSGLLSVTPYYNRPTQSGLIAHFKAIAAASPAPVILYNVPHRTGVNLTAETTLALAREEKNIVAVKEASGNLAQIMQIIKDRPDNFSVLSGDDAIALPAIAVGGHGVISVAANAFPQEVTTIIRNSLKGDFLAAQTAHYKMIDIFDTLFVEGNPSGIKAALNILGFSQNFVRLPLVPVSKKTYEKLETLIKSNIKN